MRRPATLPLFTRGFSLPGGGALGGYELRLALGAIIAAALLIGVFLGATGPGGTPPGGEPPYPVLDCEPECNVLTGASPRPANEVTVAINPTNPLNIVGAANDYGTPNGDAWVGVYSSFDGGKSWNRTLIPGYRPSASPFPQPCAGGQLPGQGLCGFEGAGDPVLAADKDGNFYVAGIAFKRNPAPLGRASSIWVAKSTDGGVTWPASGVTVPVISLTTATFHDKEWLAVDPKTSDVYVSWTAFNLLALSEIFVIHSSDGAQTWSTPVLVSSGGFFTGTEEDVHLPQVQGSQVEVDNNGTLHLAWIDYNVPNSLKYTRSTDKGRTWDTIQTIAPVDLIASPQPQGTYRTPTMPDMAVDLTNGTYGGSVYIWWPDDAGGDADILQVYSRDGGSTWSNVTRVNNDPEGNGASQFFPAVSVAGNGWVIGEFYDRRDDPENRLLSVYFAVSFDGGATYPVQVNVTDLGFDGDKSAGASGVGFIGDYLGIASSDFYAVGLWCDTRNYDNGTSTDIYSARILVDSPPPPEATG
ncbi:MAG TPA: sialidase family protein [Candidatus Thermoplasmatota archaeon]